MFFIRASSRGTALRRNFMTPLTKETAEAANQAAESAVPRTVAPAPNPARLHSEAVSLEIPIKVHGSRVTEVVLGTTPHTEPFEEQSTTMIVFAQGGVLKMSTPVTSGQMMVLTNLKTRQDVICRVLKVRNNPNLQSYVEIEFTHPQPGYWGVFFPSDDSDQAPRPASFSAACEFGTPDKGGDQPGEFATVCRSAQHAERGTCETTCRIRAARFAGGEFCTCFLRRTTAAAWVGIHFYRLAGRSAGRSFVNFVEKCETARTRQRKSRGKRTEEKFCRDGKYFDCTLRSSFYGSFRRRVKRAVRH